MIEQTVDVSVLAPAYNERESLPQLCRSLNETLSGMGRSYEIIIVDDGSTDDSLAILKGLKSEIPQLRILSLSKRSGQTAAMEAGFEAAKGKYVVTIDADLQNDPADIPAMIELLEADKADMVTGHRHKRQDSWLRRFSTRVANGVRNRLTHESVADSACALKAYKREIIPKLKLFDGLHRFLTTIAKMNGFRVLEIPVNHRPRTLGKAKYGMWNRAFRALRAAFAVRWMQRHTLIYEVKELEDEDRT
ncbi:MAG: glycosyltransferase family 2 protein [Phycisphaerae bacterium]|nr:glycosyltransferase family 2 protein [Phycisphaerae bacterium]